MQQWDFDTIHRKGALNHFPDALPRMYEYAVGVDAFKAVENVLLDASQRFNAKLAPKFEGPIVI